MSWIFSFLLGCYVLVRVVLRVRGQLRWLALRSTLPSPPKLVSAPKHLSPGLGELFVSSRELRIALIEARRTLAAVQVTDPDAALGRVRDARYRRALMENWSSLNRWLRAFRGLEDSDATRIEDLHLGPETIEQLRDSLRDKWQAVSQARALDPFELTDLRAVSETFERLGDELAQIEHGLSHVGDDPYRDRFAGPALAHVG